MNELLRYTCSIDSNKIFNKIINAGFSETIPTATGKIPIWEFQFKWKYVCKRTYIPVQKNVYKNVVFAAPSFCYAVIDSLQGLVRAWVGGR